MFDSEMISMVSKMTGETDEELIDIYLNIAKDVVLGRLYPFGRTDEAQVPSPHHMDCVRITAYLLNKRGAEGEISHSEGGVNRMYEEGDVPSSLLRNIIPYGKVPTGGA